MVGKARKKGVGEGKKEREKRGKEIEMKDKGEEGKYALPQFWQVTPLCMLGRDVENEATQTGRLWSAQGRGFRASWKGKS